MNVTGTASANSPIMSVPHSERLVPSIRSRAKRNHGTDAAPALRSQLGVDNWESELLIDHPRSLIKDS